MLKLRHKQRAKECTEAQGPLQEETAGKLGLSG